MKTIIQKLKSISRIQLLAAALILIGLAIMIPRAIGMVSFSKEARFAVEHNFQDGNPSPDLLRPWMTIRYISVAYSVPQKYLFDYAHIEPRKETSMVAINRLNQQMNLGQIDDKPALLRTLRDAILAYRANPVATGLIEQHVADWMTVQYIANCTGIPAESIFNEIGIEMDGHAYHPLGFLSDTVKYPGGPRALVTAVQQALDKLQVKP